MTCQVLHIPQIVWSRQKHSIQEELLNPPTKVGSKSSQRTESLKDYANGEGIAHKSQVSLEWKAAPTLCALGLKVQIWPKFSHISECPKNQLGKLLKGWQLLHKRWICLKILSNLLKVNEVWGCRTLKLWNKHHKSTIKVVDKNLAIYSKCSEAMFVTQSHVVIYKKSWHTP